MPEQHKAYAVQVVDTMDNEQVEYKEFDAKEDAESTFKKMLKQYKEKLPNGEPIHTVQLFSGSTIVKDNAGDQGAIRTFKEGNKMKTANDMIQEVLSGKDPKDVVEGLYEAMRKFANEKDAKDYAKKQGLYYGWSVLASGFFVGTKEELKKIGVMKPQQ